MRSNAARIRLTENIVPLSELGASAPGLMKKLRESGRAVVLTEEGRPAAVLMTPEAFDALRGCPTERYEGIGARADDGAVHCTVTEDNRRSDFRSSSVGHPLRQREQVIAAVERGRADLRAGRVIDDEDLGREFEARFGPVR